FFFPAEDGIRGPLVTGVQTCALPIFRTLLGREGTQNGNLLAAWNDAGLVERVRNLDPVNQVSTLEASTYLANMLLRDTDCMSMEIGRASCRESDKLSANAAPIKTTKT